MKKIAALALVLVGLCASNDAFAGRHRRHHRRHRCHRVYYQPVNYAPIYAVPQVPVVVPGPAVYSPWGPSMYVAAPLPRPYFGATISPYSGFSFQFGF